LPLQYRLRRAAELQLQVDRRRLLCGAHCLLQHNRADLQLQIVYLLALRRRSRLARALRRRGALLSAGVRQG
jgi:hypothetical protein